MANDGVYAGYIVTPSLGMAGHITGIFWIHFWQHFECYLVGTCWAHVEITVWMYPKCDWWIHWGKNDPEPTIYPRCSHWFPGHLAPSVTAYDGGDSGGVRGATTTSTGNLTEPELECAVVLIEILKILWALPAIFILFAHDFKQPCRGGSV